MKFTAFHAGDGDCILVTSSDNPPRRLLVDGGRSTSYVKNTRDFLGQIGAAREKLDIVCVSHIDDDHITGILRLVEDEVEWRAFEFLRTLDATTPEPDLARPPEIGEVWHNGLFRLVGGDLGHSRRARAGHGRDRACRIPARSAARSCGAVDGLATGERASLELSRRLAPEQLGIALNPPSGGQLMKRETTGEIRPAEEVTRGSLTIQLLGPSQDDIDTLRRKWQEWIDTHQKAVEQLHADLLADEQRLGTLSPRIVVNPMLDQALGEGLANVTEANLASLMLLVEENGSKALLTGDGVSSEIIAGLERHKRLDANGRIHVNILKVQHHGAKANVEEDFVRRVTADHYVFSGNGAHDNPEIEVVEAFARARLQGIAGGAPLGPATPFKFWFTSSQASPGLTASRKAHMKTVRDTVTSLRVGHQAKMLAATFLTEGNFEIVV